MLQQQVYIINTILMALDALCVIAAGYAAFFVKYYRSDGTWQIDNHVFGISLLAFMFINNYMLGKYGLYSDRRPPSNWALFISIVKSVAVSAGMLTVAIFILQNKDYSREFLFLFTLLCLVLILIQRFLFQLYFDRFSRKGFHTRRIVVVGNKDRSETIISLLESQMSWGHKVIGRIAPDNQEKNNCNIIGCINNFEQILKKDAVDEVVFAFDSDRSIHLSDYLNLCKKMGITCRILPALWSPGGEDLSVERFQNAPFLTIQSNKFNAAGLMYKRLLDILGGTIGTVLFLIMYLFIAVAIKLDSPGPVLFKQKRVGKNGRVFHLYKFRSMYPDAEDRKQDLMAKNQMNGALFKIEDDPRITRVGKWLRKTSMDEFPQFLNVLKGEMSLVGTRPPTLDEVEKYQPEHLKRISAKPGITGLWQVSGRNKITDFEQIVALDCKYMDSWRLLDDIKILIRTVVVVIQRKGAI
jgi:exopolysaccharide biosynthesis polyprenyl glycosylphosphotransferase